jgi:hypothetical protein
VQGGRPDEVVDGFDLQEVEPAGKKISAGELAWLSEPRSFAEACAKDRLEHDRRSVRRDLYDIFARVGARRSEVRDDNLVKNFFRAGGRAAGIQKLREPRSSRFEDDALLQHWSYNGASFRAGDPHDTDAAHPGCGGDGCDGLVGALHLLRVEDGLRP